MSFLTIPPRLELTEGASAPVPKSAPPALSLLFAALAAGLALAPARADDAKASSAGVRGVVELFTSQGCASCPPAEAMLARYAAAGTGIVALAYHVDYWDYIGWQDTLGSRRNVERQKDYVKGLRLGALATPQAVVNGAAAVPGGDAAAVEARLAAEPIPTGPAAPEVRLAREGDTLHIFARLGEGDRDASPRVLILVTYVAEARTEVLRGENKGRRLVSTHAVRDWRVVGTLTGEPMRVDMPIGLLADPDGLRSGGAALLQTVGSHDRPGRILAAAAIDF